MLALELGMVDAMMMEEVADDSEVELFDCSCTERWGLDVGWMVHGLMVDGDVE